MERRGSAGKARGVDERGVGGKGRKEGSHYLPRPSLGLEAYHHFYLEKDVFFRFLCEAVLYLLKVRGDNDDDDNDDDDDDVDDDDDDDDDDYDHDDENDDELTLLVSSGKMGSACPVMA